MMGEAAQAAADALADAAGALVDEADPRRDRATDALEIAAGHLYTAATLAGHLQAASFAAPHAPYVALRLTVEELVGSADTAPPADLRRAVMNALGRLEDALERPPVADGVLADAVMRRGPLETRPRASNDNQQVQPRTDRRAR